MLPGDWVTTTLMENPAIRASEEQGALATSTFWGALLVGRVEIHPDAKTGVHHHGDLESIIYIISGKARMRWGETLEFVCEAGPGDFIFIPPYVPHQEINASTDEPLHCVLVRSNQEPVVVNLDIPVVEDPEGLYWVDPIHANPEA